MGVREFRFPGMKRRNFVSLFSSAALAARAGAAGSPEPPLVSQYRETAGRLIGAALTDPAGWQRLEYLCDRIGHRLSGSPQMMRSVRWAEAEMKKDGLDQVRTPKVMVPHWVRGRESAEMISPLEVPLSMLGLGGSAGTPPAGIEAEVVCVRTFEELEARGATAVQGKGGGRSTRNGAVTAEPFNTGARALRARRNSAPLPYLFAP